MFVLLKLLLLLFRPLLWIVVLFVYALFAKRPQRKRFTFRLGLGLLIFFTHPFPIRLLMKWYEAKPVQLAPSQKFDTGIVLGGMVLYSSGDNRGYFNNASDRFIQTALLYKQGHINHIIVAAGNGLLIQTDFREAEFVKENLVQLGIPADKIYTDGNSRNTLENALYSKRIADSVHLPGPFLLISSAMHLPRAEKVFRKAGLNPVIYPCNFLARSGGNNFLEDYILPSPTAFNHWDNLIKELLGTVVYSLKGDG